MVLFFCSTPLQIYEILNIKSEYYENKKTKLYILNYFPEAEKYVEKCKAAGLFDDVVFVESRHRSRRIYGEKYKTIKSLEIIQNAYFSILEKSLLLRKICGLIWGIFYYKLNNKIFEILQINEDEDVEEILCSHFDPLIVMWALKHKKSSTEYNRYDDGTSTYYNGMYFKKGVFFKFLNIPDDMFFPRKIYSHFPEAIKDVQNINAEIIKVDYSKNDLARGILYKVFDIGCVEEIKEKVIFFDTLVPNQNMDSMILPLTTLKNERVCFKKHPRRQDDYYEEKGLHVYSGASLPFEMYCEYFDVSDKILISHCSTACISPSLFFNQSPKVILCYEFATKRNIEEYDKFNEFLNQLKVNGVPLKLFKPKDKEEYEKLLVSFNL